MFAILLTLVTTAFAAEVKIDSFYYVGTGSRVAEICGHIVNGSNAIEPVVITVDPGTNKSADYVVHASEKGKFCSLVVTYSGNAKAGEEPALSFVKSADSERE